MTAPQATLTEEALRDLERLVAEDTPVTPMAVVSALRAALPTLLATARVARLLAEALERVRGALAPENPNETYTEAACDIADPALAEARRLGLLPPATP